jgi:ABC-2 type transport system permease protein
MMRLLRAEMARLLTRRFTLLALLGLAAGIALFQVAVFVAASPPNPAEVAENQARFEYALAEWREDHDEYVQRCVDQGGTPQVCAANWPQPEAEDYGLEATAFDEIGEVAALLAVLMAALVLFVLAASFIGAEFSTGAIANWLSFVPRRGAVFAAKLVAIVLFTVAVSALASALAFAGLATWWGWVWGGTGVAAAAAVAMSLRNLHLAWAAHRTLGIRTIALPARRGK